jgi:ABC-type uncharacterized transport system fused permease/ATPase subunit
VASVLRVFVPCFVPATSGDNSESSFGEKPTSFTLKKKNQTDTSIAFPLSFLHTQLALPYWFEGPTAGSARWRLAGVLGLTLGATGVSVLFSFIGRDFFNALSAKDSAKFTEMLFKWLGAMCLGIPVYVLRDYYQQKLALEWREWLTSRLVSDYFKGRTFYRVQAQATVDNPDQRIAADVRRASTSRFCIIIMFA